MFTPFSWTFIPVNCKECVKHRTSQHGESVVRWDNDGRHKRLRDTVAKIMWLAGTITTSRREWHYGHQRWYWQMREIGYNMQKKVAEELRIWYSAAHNFSPCYTAHLIFRCAALIMSHSRHQSCPANVALNCRNGCRKWLVYLLIFVVVSVMRSLGMESLSRRVRAINIAHAIFSRIRSVDDVKCRICSSRRECMLIARNLLLSAPAQIGKCNNSYYKLHVLMYTWRFGLV